MKIEKNSLKVVSLGKWSPASKFTNDNGQSFDVPANHKIVCVDENGEAVNLTVCTSEPLSFKVSELLPSLEIIGNFSHGAFGFTGKVALVVK